jgi:hypothetical protein
MPNYFISDICPRCGEHCEGILEEDEIEESTSESTSSLEEDGFNILIEALQIFRKYGNPYSPTHCEHDVLTVCIDPAIVSEKDKLKLEGRSFRPSEDGYGFVSYRFGSA